MLAKCTALMRRALQVIMHYGGWLLKSLLLFPPIAFSHRQYAAS